MVIRCALAVVVAACGSRVPTATGIAPVPGGGGDVTLYRDRALVRQRVELDVPPAGLGQIRVTVPAGLGAGDVFVLERGGLTVAELRATATATQPPRAELERRGELLDDAADPPEHAAPDAGTGPVGPSELELVVGAPQAGHVVLHLGYVTDRITWQAAYTMTTSPARDHAVLRGAVAIRNATGVELRASHVRVIDVELDAASAKSAEQLAAGFTGAEPSTTPLAVPRDLGRLDLVDGETRVELLPDAGPRKMRSVLVYDPIGVKLDHVGAAPVRDRSLGVQPPAAPRLHESFEVERDVTATTGLPAGPVRLLERHADGTLAVLGEARLFDSSTRVAQVDTIAIGTAEGVVGRRERREFSIDDDRKRLVEEFLITIENHRDRAAVAVIREHLYRGQNWTIAYTSAVVEDKAKEGPQQFALRVTVPPNGKANLLYVVVYTW